MPQPSDEVRTWQCRHPLALELLLHVALFPCWLDWWSARSFQWKWVECWTTSRNLHFIQTLNMKLHFLLIFFQWYILLIPRKPFLVLQYDNKYNAERTIWEKGLLSEGFQKHNWDHISIGCVLFQVFPFWFWLPVSVTIQNRVAKGQQTPTVLLKSIRIITKMIW